MARDPGNGKSAFVGSRREEARSQPVAVVRTTHGNQFDRIPPGRARGATRLAESTRHTNMSERTLPPFLRPTSPRSHIRRPCAAAGGEDEGRRHQSRRERHRTARGGEPAPPAATPAEDMAKRAELSFRYAMGYEYIRIQILIRHAFGDIWVHLAGTWPNCISAVFAGVFGYFGALPVRLRLIKQTRISWSLLFSQGLCGGWESFGVEAGLWAPTSPAGGDSAIRADSWPLVKGNVSGALLLSYVLCMIWQQWRNW